MNTNTWGYVNCDFRNPIIQIENIRFCSYECAVKYINRRGMQWEEERKFLYKMIACLPTDEMQTRILHNLENPPKG